MASEASAALPTARQRLRQAAGWWQWAPVPFAIAYLVVLAVKLQQLIASVYQNADAASAPVIGELFGGPPAHRQVVLGQLGWFSTLIYELSTRWLPLHRQIWEATPYVLWMVSVALICWGALKVWDRWAAAITGALLVSASPMTIDLLSSLNDHSPTWFSLALLAATLILLQSRPRWLRPVSLALVVVAVGAVVGINAASDVSLLAAGAVPALLAPAVAWGLRPTRRNAVFFGLMLATMAIAAGTYVMTRAAMRHENVIVSPGIAHNKLAMAEAVSSNFKLWWQSLMLLGNGNFFGLTLGFTSALLLACAVLTLLAVALIPRAAWRELRAAHTAFDRGEADRQAIRVSWIVFWLCSALLLSMSFIFSSNPEDLGSSRYLVGAIYAIAALAPLLATRGVLSRAAVVGASTLFAFTALLSMLDNLPISSDTSSFYKDYAQIEKIAIREHATTGYGNYWDTAPLTWATHFRVKAYPVYDCDGTVCPYTLHSISSWYTPHGNSPTFLITDTARPPAVEPTVNVGKPSSVHQVGPITMYVYPYNIAYHMG